jgi:tetratricopeptide (TPR) repeat protein
MWIVQYDGLVINGEGVLTMATQAATSATAVKRLALWYRREGFFAQCERLFRVAICMQEREVGPTHISVAVSYYQLGEIYADLDKYDVADQHYKRATEIYEMQLKDGAEPLWHLNALLYLHELSEKEMERFQEFDSDSAVA